MYGWTVSGYLIATTVRKRTLPLADTQPFRHFVVKEAVTEAIGLDPFAINDELGDGSLAGSLHDFLGGAGCFLDVNFGEGKLVLRQKALGLPAVGTPGG